MTIRSEQFDDVYFSIHDGLAEARHVFLAGNNLPDAWQGIDDFVILETGFGTGLNFLVAWAEFERTAKANQHLHFISFEKYPLAPSQIRDALAHWPELSSQLERMLALYPLRVGGWHRIDIAPHIHLTLIFDDVNKAISELDISVDAIFLDGFAPAKNADMWSDILFENLGRISHAQTTAATFSAARIVRDGLSRAGFSVEKPKGFGRKRDMLKAVSEIANLRQPITRTKKLIGIIGAGLAGAALAHSLQSQGHEVRVYETADQPALGASGNLIGLYNPRFTATRSPEAEFYMSAFAKAYSVFSQLKNIDFNPCGALHLVTDDEKQKRFSSMMDQWGWHKDDMQYLDVRQASAYAGISLNKQALWLPQSGFVSPPKLVKQYLKDIDVTYTANPDYNQLTHDVIILAHGRAIEGLPMSTVRGQITYATAHKALPLKANICYGGYCSAAINGQHILGSTFQPWLTDTTQRDADHAQNLTRLEDHVPSLKGEFTISGGRAGLRLSSQDRFPVIGPYKDNVYLSLAHGSHGLLSSLMAAQIIADHLATINYGLPRKTSLALAPERFALRKSRKIGSNSK